MVAELEEQGLDYRIANAIETWLTKQAEACRSIRGEAPGEIGLECLTVGYLCQFSAEDLDMPNFGPMGLKKLRAALRAVRMRLRGD